MCSRAPRSTQQTHSCYSDLHPQHKLNTYGLQSFSLNTNIQLLMCSIDPFSTQNISSIMCFRVHAQHKHIYIICNWIMPSISNKSSCSYVVWSLTQYIQIKHQGNIIINGAHAHTCQVQNSGYYTKQPMVLGGPCTWF